MQTPTYRVIPSIDKKGEYREIEVSSKRGNDNKYQAAPQNWSTDF